MRIDVKTAIASKNAKLAKLLPCFLIRALEKIVSQDQMNQFLEKHDQDPALEFAKNSVEVAAQVTYNIVNEENVPKTGRYIIACNHPLGGIDGVAMLAVMSKYRSDIKIPANDIIMQVKPLHEVLIPINKHGSNNRDVSNYINEVFASDDLIIYFPAGLCSRENNGVLMDPEWKKTIVKKSKEYQRDIVPVFFDGRNTDRFYRIARWRRRLGIKVNIEMLFLPSEVFRHKGETFNIIFGKPIPYQTFDKSKTDYEWTAWLQEQVYALKK
jgi:putative hemolysin